MHHEKEVTSQVLRGQRNERGTSAQVPAQSIRLLYWYFSQHVEHLGKKRLEFRSRYSSRQILSRQKASIEFSEPALWVGWFLATLRRAPFYILLSRGSAIGIFLNVTLLAYASDEKLYSARANFPNQAKKNRAGVEKIVVFATKPLLGKMAQRGHP